MSWHDLDQADPELASFGFARLRGSVAYLATVRQNGAPRVHPVTPILGEGRLFVFMEPTSPKGHDLRRDPRYALHSAVHDGEGSNGEFSLSGIALFVTDPHLRALAVTASTYAPRDRHILFELSVDSAASTIYSGDNAPARRRWERKKR